MYNISLQEIEYFLTVAEKQNITEAAAALYVTQPAVSKWIQHLEKQLNVKLFTRSRSGVSLTEKGYVLYSEWRPLLDGIYNSIEKVRAMDDTLQDELNIGCLSGFNFDHFLPKMLSNYHEKYPEVETNIFYYDFKKLRESLLEGETDVIITTSFDLDTVHGVAQKVIEKLYLSIAISSSHPLAQREHLNLFDVKDEPFFVISTDQTQTGSGRVLRACQRQGFSPAHIHFASSLPSMAMAVKQGRGVAICSKLHFVGSEQLVRLYDTADLPVDEYIVIAWRTSNMKYSTMRFVEAACAMEVP